MAGIVVVYVKGDTYGTRPFSTSHVSRLELERRALNLSSLIGPIALRQSVTVLETLIYAEEDSVWLW